MDDRGFLSSRTAGWRSLARARWGSLVVAVLFVSGCSNNESISLSPEETQLKPCPETSARPAQGDEEVDLLPVVKVSDLPTKSPVSCDLEGWALQFPDGGKIEIGEPGSYRDQQSTEGAGKWSSLMNLGVYGVVASSQEGLESQRWWGTPKGIEKVRDAEIFSPPIGQ